MQNELYFEITVNLSQLAHPSKYKFFCILFNDFLFIPRRSIDAFTIYLGSLLNVSCTITKISLVRISYVIRNIVYENQYNFEYL